jgi:hypothetical protein
MRSALDVRIEWESAQGVSTPELAATWARYEVWVDGTCVTQVESKDGTLRRSVYGSLYPLAEWIVSNWWLLKSHIRPTAVEARYSTWRNSNTQPWLEYHNFRAAGNGMAWPNLTLIPEGATVQATWFWDRAPIFESVRFAVNGRATIRASDALEGLATAVENVLGRLAETGHPNTRLAEEWAAVSDTDAEEADFCRTVARLGLDPYSIDDDLADQVITVASRISAEVAADFFDTADPAALDDAATWAQQAMAAAQAASADAREDLSVLLEAVTPVKDILADLERPWRAGYEMARRVRQELGVGNTADFDPSPWVGIGQISGASHGLQGVGAVNDGRCGAVFGNEPVGTPSRRFGSARVLGRALMESDAAAFVLSSARGRKERAAGAFAAELLAPADAIREGLTVIGEQSDAAFEAVARYFKVSPLLVRHQYDNQIASDVDFA